jgi:hypothetical protein
VHPLPEKLDKLSWALFANGWSFIVPYLLFYIVFKFLNLPIGPLRWIFVCLHICLAPLLAVYLWKVSRTADISDYAFWLLLILVFLLPGAYLEIPSDPWEHFRRVFAWQQYSSLNDSDLNLKFSYFWGWTLMSAVPPADRRIAAGFYSAFWQLLLAYQFYLLGLRLGFSKSWAKVLVIGTVCLFGANVFSFYRYYALASTVPAYIAYLAALIVLLNAIEGRRKQLLLLPLLLLILFFNHFQELMFLGVSSLALGMNWLWSQDRFRFQLKIVLLAIGSVSIILGFLAVRYGGAIGFNSTALNISSLAMIRIWDPSLLYFEAIGALGVTSLALAVLLFRKYRLVALLTLMPSAILLFPPFVIIYSIALGADNWLNWRILYAFPISFMLAAGLKEVGEFVIRNRGDYTKFVPWVAVVILVAISMFPSFPIRGRLWFVLHRPPPELTLTRTDSTAQWLFDNRHEKLSCLVTADHPTGTVLAAEFGLAPLPERLNIRNVFQFLSDVGPLDTYLRNNHVCGFLIGIPSQVPAIPSSEVAELSRHWSPFFVYRSMTPQGDLESVLGSLTAAGWTRTLVPPDYYLFEPPER